MTNSEQSLCSQRDRLFYQEGEGTLKAAIYCRLSEEDRNKANRFDDSNSIKNQKAMLMQYAYKQNWDIYDIYSDDDYTGADRNRPQFKRLLADAEARMFDIILCKTQSRFTRELELVERYIHGLFPIWGVRFVSIVDNADTANKGNKKSRQINGLVNEWYLEDMSDNIRSVLTSRRQNGFHIGSFAPYGYEKDPDAKGHLIIDEEAAQVVKEIFAMYVDGYGKTAIAKTLNDKGIPNPTEYKRQKGFRYVPATKNAGPLWKYSSVQAILANEVYIGNLVQGKLGTLSYKTKQLVSLPKDRWIRVEGTHEPIIDRELWDKAQKRIGSGVRASKKTGRVRLFTGIAVCMHCGYSLKSHISHDRIYLQCETKYISKAACPGAFIPEAELKQIVINQLQKYNQALLDMDKLERLAQFESALVSKKSGLLADKKRYQKKVNECNDALKQLYTDKAIGIITTKDYHDLSDVFQTDKARYEELIMTCEEQILEAESSLKKGDNRSEMLKQYVKLQHFDRSVSEFLIERIEVGKRNPKIGQVPVRIKWNF